MTDSNMANISEFRQSLNGVIDDLISQSSKQYPREECLKIDLHCHDKNSDNPDELWGRILGLPETWLKTEKLIKRLQESGCDAFTITNHNNAKSCWKLLDKGVDVLVAAEFTCYFPEYSIFVHVLAYGFSKKQEKTLNRLRRDIYAFLRYAHKNNIPVILPHPMYFYTRNDRIDLALFEKMAVLFQNFEVLNGQRDQWQSALTLAWLRGLNGDKIRSYAEKHDLDPADFGVDPDRPKVMSGGSDDHMGIFAGQSGSYLHVPDLVNRLKTEKKSELALEALRAGRIAPYGSLADNQKLNITLLDYFSQVAVNLKDPGLLRIFFHRGETSDKLACLTIANLMLEMQKHGNTKKFFNFIHDALQGKKPNKLVKWKIKKDYHFCIEHLESIADARKESPEALIATVNKVLPELFHSLSMLMIKRLGPSFQAARGKKIKSLSTAELTRHFEVPSQLSALFLGNGKSMPGMSHCSVSKLLDHLSFPSLVSIVLLGTSLASTRLLYQNRRFLNEFADHLGESHHPRRALYLTDTLLDRNGVSSSLSANLAYIEEQDLAVDFLICHPDAESRPHLHVVRPLTEFSLPDYGEQIIRVPDLMEITRIFYAGGYDRVVCSTEGPMAAAALLIKHMFNVPAYFFMHTDWLEFIKNTTDLNKHERDRLRRVLRFFYRMFAGVFVLNEDHRDWLTGYEMQLDSDKVMLTAHHAKQADQNIVPVRVNDLFPEVTDSAPVMLYAGRISKEKGVFELPDIYHAVRRVIPEARMIVAGTGPALDALKSVFPEALYTGWLDKARLAQLYAGLDLMVFPTRFDTFGNVIIEAMSYGMPVISYNCLGPKSIIEHGVNGYLAEDKRDIAERAVAYLQSKESHALMRARAVKRSQEYEAGVIMQRFISDLGLEQPVQQAQSVSTNDGKFQQSVA